MPQLAVQQVRARFGRKGGGRASFRAGGSGDVDILYRTGLVDIESNSNALVLKDYFSLARFLLCLDQAAFGGQPHGEKQMKLFRTLAIVALVAQPMASHAALILKAEDVNNAATATWNSPTNIFVGATPGTIIGDWLLGSASGLGVGLLANNPDFMDLSSLEFSTAVSGGHFRISLTQTDLSGPALATLLGFAASIGGTTNGMITATLYIDDANAEFGTGTTIWSQSYSQPPTQFSLSGAGSATVSGLYSATMVVDVTHTSATQTSFDMSARRVPEPGALALLGFGLLGLGLSRRRVKG